MERYVILSKSCENSEGLHVNVVRITWVWKDYLALKRELFSYFNGFNGYFNYDHFLLVLWYRSLLEELSDFAAKNKDPEEDKDMETAPSQSSRGLIQDR